MSTVTDTHTINGMDVERMRKTIDAIRKNRGLARFQFRAHNRWHGGGWNRSEIREFYGCGGEDTTRVEPFILDSDEPQVLLGEDHNPNPAEYVLHALAGCLTTTLAMHCAGEGIEIESIESTVDGEVDLQGFLGMDENVRKGFEGIHVTMRVKSDAPREKLAELARYSPVYDTLTRPVPVDVKIEMV